MTRINPRQFALIVSTLGLGIIVFVVNLSLSLATHHDSATVWRSAGWTLVLVLFMVGLATVIVANRPLMVVADRESMRGMRRQRETELPQYDSGPIAPEMGADEGGSVVPLANPKIYQLGIAEGLRRARKDRIDG